jgi:tripartite-type tricarboxylate transporter receptor subunit TctC
VYTHVVPLLLAVHPSVGASNVRELAAWIKANPGKAVYASSGSGSSLHMAAELFMSMTATKMQHVPLQRQLGGASGPARRPQRDDLRHRDGHPPARAFPELPTIAESGLTGYDASTWGGILAPAGTPKDVVSRLNGAINAALKLDEVRLRLTSAGIEIQGGTPGEFGDVIKAEIDKWGRSVKEAGIQPE